LKRATVACSLSASTPMAWASSRRVGATVQQAGSPGGGAGHGVAPAEALVEDQPRRRVPRPTVGVDGGEGAAQVVVEGLVREAPPGAVDRERPGRVSSTFAHPAAGVPLVVLAGRADDGHSPDRSFVAQGGTERHPDPQPVALVARRADRHHGGDQVLALEVG